MGSAASSTALRLASSASRTVHSSVHFMSRGFPPAIVTCSAVRLDISDNASFSTSAFLPNAATVASPLLARTTSLALCTSEAALALAFSARDAIPDMSSCRSRQVWLSFSSAQVEVPAEANSDLRLASSDSSTAHSSVHFASSICPFAISSRSSAVRDRVDNAVFNCSAALPMS